MNWRRRADRLFPSPPAVTRAYSSPPIKDAFIPLLFILEHFYSMWLLPLVCCFPLLLVLHLPSCFAFKIKRRRKKTIGADSRTPPSTSLSTEDVTTTTMSSLTRTTTPTPTPVAKASRERKSKCEQPRSDKEEKELFKQLKMDKSQIAAVRRLPKKEQENWKKWMRLNLTKEVNRADSYFLAHDCKGLTKNNCKGCLDYLKLIKSLRIYHQKYGGMCPTPANEEEISEAAKEIEQRAYWFGLMWNSRRFSKMDVSEWQDAKARNIVNNDRKRRKKIKNIIKDWRKARKKREKEKQKLEKKKLAQKREMEKKQRQREQKKETKQPAEPQYESIFDTEGGNQIVERATAAEEERKQSAERKTESIEKRTESKVSKVSVDNGQYESLFDAEGSNVMDQKKDEGGQKKKEEGGGQTKQKKQQDEEQYENLVDPDGANLWEEEKKNKKEEKREEKKPKTPKVSTGESQYETIFDAVAVSDEKKEEVRKEEKKTEDKKERKQPVPAEPEGQYESLISEKQVMTAETPEKSSDSPSDEE